MSYATPNDMKLRYDVGILGQYCSDDGTALSSSALTTSEILLALLADASGLIESSALAGGRYSADDLNNLTGNSEGLLVRLTCDIAFYWLAQRRPTGTEQRELPMLEKAMDMLDRLRRGENIFNVAAAIDAGLPHTEPISPQVISQQRYISDNPRYFPLPWRSQDQL